MRSINDLGILLDTLERKVLQNGDTVAYDDLMIELLDYNEEERIKWSKIMAEKHHYTRACTDYFQFLIMKCDPDLTCLTTNERDTAILYLKKAIYKGDSLAIQLKADYNIK